MVFGGVRGCSAVLYPVHLCCQIPRDVFSPQQEAIFNKQLVRKDLGFAKKYAEVQPIAKPTHKTDVTTLIQIKISNQVKHEVGEAEQLISFGDFFSLRICEKAGQFLTCNGVAELLKKVQKISFQLILSLD